MAAMQIIAPEELATWQDHAAAITESWQKSVLGILETGQRLLKAKHDLEFGDFGKIFEKRAVPFCDRTGQMLMAVARHAVLSNTKNSSVLPAAWYYLYELTTLPESRVAGWIGDGTIHAGMKSSDIYKLRRLCADERRIHPVQSVPGKYSLILADPPWLYQFAESNSRAIENQYPTLTLEQLCDHKLKRCFAADCILFLWATSPKCKEAMTLLEAWGFEYKTNMVWIKDKIGMGYYARQQHELLLIGTKGKIRPPEPANRPSSVIEGARTKHSVKPSSVYAAITQMYPEFANEESRVELFCRVKPEGWSAWGNQV